MTKQIGFSVLLFILSLSQGAAQSYGTAAGLRVGDGIGITLQQQVAVNTTVEGILQSAFRSKDVTLSALIEQHKGLVSKGFNFYIGLGPYYTWKYNDPNATTLLRNNFGLSPIGGLELTVRKMNISFDFKPLIKVSGSGPLFVSQSSLSLRYVFAGRYFKDDKWKFWNKWSKKKQ